MKGAEYSFHEIRWKWGIFFTSFGLKCLCEMHNKALISEQTCFEKKYYIIISVISMYNMFGKKNSNFPFFIDIGDSDKRAISHSFRVMLWSIMRLHQLCKQNCFVGV